jgi:hypothetical protein
MISYLSGGLRCANPPYGLKAALWLQPREFRAWLLQRVRTAPLAAPIDPARFTILDADIAALLNKLPLRVDDADRGTGDQIAREGQDGASVCR